MKAVYPEQDPAHPFDDRRLEFMDWGYADHRRRGGGLDEAVYRAEAQRVLSHPTPERLERLGIWNPPSHHPAPEPIPWVPDAGVAASIAADAQPDIGADMPDLLLGPLADLELPRRVLRIALAEGCFSVLHGHDRSPFRRWCRAAPIPSRAERAALRAVDHAPLTVWDLLEVDGDRARVREQIGISVHQRPPEVRLVDVHGVPGSDPAAARTLVARVVRDGSGWRTAWGLLTERRVDPAALKARVDRLWLEVQLLDRGRSRDQALWNRGFVLGRFALSGAM